MILDLNNIMRCTYFDIRSKQDLNYVGVNWLVFYVWLHKKHSMKYYIRF
jgi:hypothetical protein